MPAYIIEPDDDRPYITSDSDDGFVDRIYPEHRRQLPFINGERECRIRLVG